MILISKGNGKGKTTSAIGQAIRVLGHGGKVAFLQFIKSDKFKTGEEKILKSLKNVYFYKGGLGFVGIMGDNLPLVEHKRAAEKTFNLAKKIILSKKYNLVVLDEINNALQLKLLKTKDVVEFLKAAKKKIGEGVDMFLTGRGAPKSLIKIADLVSEVVDVKHPFHKNIKARKGREF